MRASSSNKLSDRQIVKSWAKNVEPWVSAVREGAIESRVLVSNQAIIAAVLDRAPKTVLDVGCGEGWLIRELAQSGISALGIDVVPELISYAQQEGGGRFKSMAFEDLSNAALQERFDAIVCNFSLLGKESVAQLLQAAPSLLNEGGAIIVQTIHPVSGCGNGKYEDGWREGSWDGFSDKFCDPAPWYFRTLESWQALFAASGFRLSEILEPLNPKTKLPASVVFIGLVVG